ncbi:hypothetical protein [Paenibacillus sp. GCM10027626]|uniref:hypothetical protein n=1 Tax=Paenibacillus sp. GCM10027626 TaxID=3273411 RepID=UPI0036418BBA
MEIEDIISFLTKNIYFVIIALGFLFSLLSKRKGGNAGKRMPDFGGSGPLGMDRPKANPSAERGNPYSSDYDDDDDDRWQEPERPAADQPRGFAGAEPRSYDHIRAKQEELEQRRAQLKTEPERRQPAAHSTDKAPQTTQESPALHLANRNELAKAVLMAEVLGPPRAKKPFRR